MNTVLWILQSMVALVFLYSGINKSIFSEQKLIASGQTGVAGLPQQFIKFIGISEIFGAFGLILPLLFKVLPILTAISALCLAFIMLPAAIIHYRRKEYKNVLNNCVIFLICLFIAYGRSYHIVGQNEISAVNLIQLTTPA
jgi:uncharacterized membrane protein YphA (DoxX/SURF4 family)